MVRFIQTHLAILSLQSPCHANTQAVHLRVCSIHLLGTAGKESEQLEEEMDPDDQDWLTAEVEAITTLSIDRDNG